MVNKYIYGFKLEVDYGQGWEYETFETVYSSYKENRRLYKENCKYPQRWTKARELNPNYVEQNQDHP